MDRIDCFMCGKEGLTHNEIGLNKKMLSRNIEKFLCIQCLADYLELTPEELEDYIEEFKADGCGLFV